MYRMQWTHAIGTCTLRFRHPSGRHPSYSVHIYYYIELLKLLHRGLAGYPIGFRNKDGHHSCTVLTTPICSYIWRVWSRAQCMYVYCPRYITAPVNICFVCQHPFLLAQNYEINFSRYWSKYLKY